jgi:hypothetical protein
MALATVDEFKDRLGRTLDADEERRAQAIIDDVSALVVSYCKRTFGDPPPADVRAVVLSESISAFNTVPGIRSENIGDVQVSYSYSTGSGSLSSSSRTALNYYRVKFATIRMTTVEDGSV